MNIISLIRNYLIISLLMLTIAEVPAQWTRINSGTVTVLHSIHFSDSNNGYAVGEGGTILKSTDGGSTWQNVSPPGVATFYDVFVFSQNEAVVTGGGGLIVRTTNGGVNWNIITSVVSDELLSVSFIGSNGVCGGSSQTILYSTDSGASWNISQSGFFGGGFWGAVMLDTQLGFVAGQNSIFQPMLGSTTDSGVNWNFTPFYLNNNEGRATGVSFTDVNNGYVSSAVWDGRGAISKTTNSGTDWVTTFNPSILEDINFPPSGASLTGYVVGQSGNILKTNNAGTSWEQQQSGTFQTLNKVFFIDIDNGFAVGDSGIILKTTNGGIPVELVSFTAKADGENVILNWVTASEINNMGFEIERTAPSKSPPKGETFGEWQTVGFVEGNGTTTEIKFYSFVNRKLNPGTYYYRLKQIDFDGSFEYSSVVEVSVSPDEFSLSQNYPNPFNPTTKIKFTIPDLRFTSLKVFDLLGREIATLVDEYRDAGSYEVEFTLRNFSEGGLTSGIYLYRLSAGEFKETKKLMILK